MSHNKNKESFFNVFLLPLYLIHLLRRIITNYNKENVFSFYTVINIFYYLYIFIVKRL